MEGQPVAIKALAALPPHVKLIILGDAQGREAYRDKLKALAAAQGVTSRLILAPHNQNMPLMLAASDIVLSTSVEPEAFGRVAIEAQAMCKPIIATAHGGTLETVLPEKTGLWVPPDDVDALSGAIQRCLNGTEFDPAFTRRHIAKNFSKQQLQEKTLGVYRQLIEK
jgi:glycosyltransferase involved in cell wall biosynthesis